MIILRMASAGLGLVLACGALACATPAASAQALECAQTTTSPATPVSAGNPCWTDANPYPFGFDGNPVQTSSAGCQTQVNKDFGDGFAPCYLRVDSLAFRAWNRGLAVVSPPDSTVGTTTLFGLWRYNGIRWSPDPTFPGQTVCKGNTVLWAGKLDYWIVGALQTGSTPSWPALCRFDGANFAWEPVAVPKAALAHVPLTMNVVTGLTSVAPGAITSGACFSWNNCWFFGTYGVVLHWDGGSLTDATPDPAAPWLRSDYTAAVARTDAAGNPFAAAVSASAAGQVFTAPGQLVGDTETPISAEPDGLAPPQLFGSAGGGFTPLGLTPPTDPLPGDPFQTDLVAVDFDSQGDGWVAGNPRGLRVGSAGSSGSGLAPLVKVSAGGTELPCPGISTSAFTGPPGAGSQWWLWSSIATLPDGDAFAAGESNHAPVLVRASCDSPPQITSFAGSASLSSGYMTSVAANASNDAWAAASTIASGVDVPHLYHFTDGQTPLAPAGDDNEPRPLPASSQPTVFVLAPPVVVPPPPPPTTVPETQKGTHKIVKLPAAINHVRVPRKLTPAGKGLFRLVISFHVVRTVRIGAEALRGHKVVSSTGLKTFHAGSGRLVLVLSPRRWPTKIKFIMPHTAK